MMRRGVEKELTGSVTIQYLRTTAEIEGKYILACQISTWETAPTTTGKLRTKLKLQDATGSMDGFYWGALPSALQAECWVKLEGKLKAFQNPNYPTPYKSLSISDIEILTGPAELEQPPNPAPKVQAFMQAVQKAKAEPPKPISVSQEYLPTLWEGRLLVELHTLLGKYIEEMKKK